MPFKTSVLFCVLYFFTETWSIGLDKDQIRKLVALPNDEGTFRSIVIITYLLEVGYTGDDEKLEKKQSLPFCSSKEKEFVVNIKTMPDFLILLADNNKNTDCWKNEGFTTYEVKLFVRMFIVQDKRGVHDGLLNGSEIIELFNNLRNQTDEHKQNVKNEFPDGEPINVLMYLAAILKHKSKLKHLNEAQINKCQALYKSTKKYLDNKKQKKLFKTLGMVPKKYNFLLDFEHVRSAALELQELLVFWSEQNEEYDRSAPLITQVRQYMWEFAIYDLNKDGLLDIYELEEARFHTPNSDMNTFFSDWSIMMCPAMFLKMKLALHPEYYADII
ncbi:uncharacterized protein LOC126844957 isoform X2 [Adelges cooleyi]|uniref:uncharacterized protein LOC126844957 isoform X2 n=1 Tax=Adelges cooleyi TaxID=133065 RepID=UPI00217F9A96|nr:uncharacterized protein LOC126844957 isoform X2 [Adelges cooleyi]